MKRALQCTEDMGGELMLPIWAHLPRDVRRLVLRCLAETHPGTSRRVEKWAWLDQRVSLLWQESCDRKLLKMISSISEGDTMRVEGHPDGAVEFGAANRPILNTVVAGDPHMSLSILGDGTWRYEFLALDCSSWPAVLETWDEGGRPLNRMGDVVACTARYPCSCQRHTIYVFQMKPQ